MNFKIGDKVTVVKDILADNQDTGGCVGRKGVIVGLNIRNEVLLDGVPVPLGFDDFELELIK